jgi:hypothetical protein
MNPETPLAFRRTRSPSYPAISLPAGLENLQRIFNAIQHHPAPIEALAAALDMKAGGSALNGRLSALKKFGLLEEIDGTKGSNKSYRITRLGKDLLHSPDSEEYRAAIRQAALQPAIYSALWQQFGPALPSNHLLKSHLVRDRNFNTHQVDGMIADFRETIAFSGLEGESGAPTDTAPATDHEDIGQIIERFTSIPSSPQATAPKRGEVFTIPLEDGKIASIPYPMSRQTWELFLQTLQLWEPRLVIKPSSPDAAS